jgi:ketosteroid isomerase-like protein
MSQETVELVRRANDAFRRGDWATLEANADTHVLVRADSSWPEQYIYGRDALIGWYRSGWESLGPDVRIEEILDLGDRALVRNCWTVHGQHSGLAGELRWSEIVTFREGRSVFIEMFLEHGHALEAVGREPG